jgi:hypothetical protein
VLTQSIAVLEAARSLLEASPSNASRERSAEDALISCMVQLASAYNSRYMHTADVKDLEDQISCCEVVLTTPEPGKHYKTATQLLSEALRNQFQRSQDAQDINRSISLLRGLLDLAPLPTAPLLSQLGRSLVVRFQWSGDLLDLEEAVTLQEQPLGMHSTRDFQLAQYQISLAQTLMYRYTKFGASEDLERCIQLATDSAALQEGHRDRHVSLNVLAVLYTILAMRSGNLASLDSSIECFDEILTLLGNSHPRYPRTLLNLGNALQHRYIRKGSLLDLNRAIELSRESLALLPENSHSERHGVLANLSISLFDRFDIVGDVEDEDASIALGREALSMVPPGHVNRQRAMGYLSNHIGQRYRRTENQEDMMEAMSIHEELVSSFDSGERSAVYDHALIHFADFLIARHRFTGSREDLDRAISLHEHLFQNGITEPLVETECLHSAANALLWRFQLSHDETDLVNAIAKLEAVSAIPHPQLYLALQDLSNALQLRFKAKGVVDDMETAMKYQTMALERVSIGHPGRSHVLYGFARIHIADCTTYHNFPLALEHASNALLDTSSSVQSRIQGFIELLPDVASAAFQHEEANAHLFDVFRHALHLLPQMAFLGLDVRERLRILKHTEHLAALSADLALRLDRPNDAVEVLEEGRAVFWTQFLRLRTKFDLLPPDLAEQLVKLARQIDKGTQRFNRHQSGDGHKKDRAAEDAAFVANRQLAVQFESLVEEARLLPGFECFLLHEPYPVLSRVAENCPVVVLLATNNSCAAILIRNLGAATEHVSLPGITVEQLQKLARSMQGANRNARNTRSGRAMHQMRLKGDGAARTLRELWEYVGQPLVKAIGLPVRDAIARTVACSYIHFYEQRSNGQARPRLLLCATGAFSHLPIHAAHVSEAPENFTGLTDFVVPSYTPTLGAVLNARRDYQKVHRSDAKVLLACAPNPYKWNSLPFATQEVSEVEAVLPSTSVLRMSENSRMGATVSEIQEKLPEASILHLACHGHQDPEHPLDSGFVLRDAMLTVSDIMALRLPHAFLAFLSACETAKGDEKQPDQAVHLAAAMLFAGFKSIVGTMWYV